MEYYQQLVLQAQTEIAETYYLQGKLAEAADFFQRLLKQDRAGLNKEQIGYKLLNCLAGLGQDAQAVEQSRLFLERHRASAVEPEVRYLLAAGLQRLGQKTEALEQVQRILQRQQHTAEQSPTHWIYWQQRAGNHIANQLYQEGDFVSALMVYSALADLNSAPEWRLPVWYQMGLAFEKLEQPRKAIELYTRIVDVQKELATPAGPGLQTVMDMAGWRLEFLGWQTETKTKLSTFVAPPAQPNPASSTP
jgi:tetratricopeptide (TPR) repeat protein